ncbi:COX15/CtaA family protein [Litorimonas sp. RW-G-Af-16]|uniref:COX15/CtaA family protein n=1 Tax=Litorimonas sp. RW-G-Af-16 TaxID=3241168 RepID=UPI00390CC23E
MITGSTSSKNAISLWLLIVMLLVAAIIVVGGATRLTNSGLSITEWAPITGALPPLSTEAWLAEFEKYKLIPEFEAEHPDMDLAGFKFIYFWEWAHRQLGRFIGLAYVVPLLIFAVRKKLPEDKGLLFLIPAVLIGCQGAIGWWMVHSGLQEGMVNVSQYRLATHLGMAFIILAILYWLRKSTLNEFRRPPENAFLMKRTGILAGLVYLQIIAGAFVAGTKSGLSYNTWPLMDGSFIPSGYFVQTPMWRNLFENTPAIQFNHRMLAYIILAWAIWVWVKARGTYLQGIATMFMVILLWQVVLGIVTLLTGVENDALHIGLALGHQFSSILVFVIALGLFWKSRHFIR